MNPLPSRYDVPAMGPCAFNQPWRFSKLASRLSWSRFVSPRAAHVVCVIRRLPKLMYSSLVQVGTRVIRVRPGIARS